MQLSEVQERIDKNAVSSVEFSKEIQKQFSELKQMISLYFSEGCRKEEEEQSLLSRSSSCSTQLNTKIKGEY